ncbi:zinc ribbon domain-containing protein [Gottschalkiaceae bacterium SANA]|nr:zinc ribbon domain-containing protein [Gottschalkiaceae bacterium SANA]
MFFIGIFGIQDRKKKIAEPKGACSGCGRESLALIQTERIFHFFFLPVFHWNRQYFLACENCEEWIEISSDRAERLLAGDSVGPWDMPGRTNVNDRFCSDCGYRAGHGDVFCAKCGAKLEEE